MGRERTGGGVTACRARSAVGALLGVVRFLVVVVLLLLLIHVVRRGIRARVLLLLGRRSLRVMMLMHDARRPGVVLGCCWRTLLRLLLCAETTVSLPTYVKWPTQRVEATRDTTTWILSPSLERGQMG